MACPYFYPVAPRANEGGPSQAMLPLADLWAGSCCAVAGRKDQPDEGAVRPLCNMGYARGVCSRFPADDPGPDAVRFTVSRDDGARLLLHYVLERDHHPFAHGRLEYAVTDCRFVPAVSGEVLCRQAEAYVLSYLQRKFRGGFLQKNISARLHATLSTPKC